MKRVVHSWPLDHRVADPRTEFAFIDWIRSRTPVNPRVPIGIGDDAALLHLGQSSDCLITVDMLMDGVDFYLHETEPSAVGHKALAVSLSDIAAMAGQPSGRGHRPGSAEGRWPRTRRANSRRHQRAGFRISCGDRRWRHQFLGRAAGCLFHGPRHADRPRPRAARRCEAGGLDFRHRGTGGKSSWGSTLRFDRESTKRSLSTKRSSCTR